MPSSTTSPGCILPEFIPSIKAPKSADHYYQLGFDGQAGTHYLLEEKGNLKLNASLFSLSLFWDKTSASDDTTIAGQDIPYTNNSGGISFGYQWTFQKLALGFNSSFSVRQDEYETYYFNSLGQSAIKKRRDMTYINEPWVSWKLSSDLTGVLFYSSSRVTSNMTSLDIIDRNINNSVTGLLLKKTF